MVAVTYGVARNAAPAKSGRKQKGPFARFYDALLESRLRAAQREIALHRHLYKGWHSDQISLEKETLPFDGR